MLDLTSEQIANAEAAGVSFPAATPAQVQRYAMQQKVFRIDGAPHLATRGGSLFETAATLERLIAEGERERRDLAAWRDAAPEPQDEAPAPLPRPADDESGPAPPLANAAETGAPTPSGRWRARVPPGERWQTAGALRRGRLRQHWSLRGTTR